MKPTTGAPLGIPERYEDVTNEWLTQALRAGGVLGKQTVIGFSVEPISATRSRLSSLASISVSYDEPSSDLPDTLFAKFVSRIPANRALAADRGVFQSEIALYKRLGGMMPLNMPKLYFGLAEETSDVAVLLLEEIDGIPKSGLPGVDEWSLTKSEALLALRELSGMHSKWWEDESLGEHSWLLPVDSDRRRIDLPHKYVPVLMLVWQAQEQVDLPGQSQVLVACSRVSCVALSGCNAASIARLGLEPPSGCRRPLD